jgi:hypothetical protein
MKNSVIVASILVLLLGLGGCKASAKDSTEAVSSEVSSEVSSSVSSNIIIKTVSSEPSAPTFEAQTYEVLASVNSDMPKYRFVARGLTEVHYYFTELDNERGAGYVVGLEAYDESGKALINESWPLEEGGFNERPVQGEMMDTLGLHVVDVNFDGYKDVIVLNCFAGAHGNSWYDCWLWDAKTSSFVADKAFAEICNPSLDPEQKCIYSWGGSGAEFWGGTIYKFIDGKFVVSNSLEGDRAQVVESKLVNGKMETVRTAYYGDNEKARAAEYEYYKNSKLWQLENPRWYHTGGHRADEWLGGT